jgi:NTE family protein
MALEPVERLPGEDEDTAPAEGVGLCLSGGGYRAMLFHTGALWRLYEAGMLKGIARISSVSGGSITAAMLGLKWGRLSFDPARVRQDFATEVVTPIRALAGTTLDAEAVIVGLVLPGSIGARVSSAYREYLFGDATLQDLPDDPAPRFVINASNVQSGALWRFMKPYMRDWRVGEVKRPTVTLADAVAASSAFPPVLSPFELRLDPRSFTPRSGHEDPREPGTSLQKPPFTDRVVLSDGGVYDNLGLETVWKKYRTVLVSDAGGKMEAEEEPKRDWARHSYRVLNLIDDQVRSLRKRLLIASYKAGPETGSGSRRGAYWGIRGDMRNYVAPGAFAHPLARTRELANTPTRLKRLDDGLQERLINWGHAICDAALRKHVDKDLAKPGLPYPAAGI